MTSVLEQPPLGRLARERAIEGHPARRNELWYVIALTVLAGLWRLLTASSPGLWADEAHTFRRVCGSFAELVAMLRGDALPPLHYYLYWLLGRALGGPQHLTPFWMRFIPAIAGTLMVPAMWRLARQFCDSRTALLVAAFSACSAFLFAHSHDAKMYMPLWALVAFSFSFWISWLREGPKWHWGMWVASSIVMVGYHASGMVLPFVELASLAAMKRPRAGKIAMAALGFILIPAGPVAYYVWGNDLISHSRDMGWHGASGLGWLHEFDRTGTDPSTPLLRLTTTYLLGWGWTGSHAATPFDSRVRASLMAASSLLLLACLAGAVLWVVRLARSPAGELGRERFARMFVIGFWLVVPLFVAYRLSGSADSQGAFAAAAMACFAVAFAVMLKLAWRPVRTWLLSRHISDPLASVIGAALLVALLAILIGSVVAAVVRSPGESSSVWVPRYLAFVWPAFAIAICAAISALNPPALRWGAVGLLLGVNVAQSAALVLADTEPPVGRIVRDVSEAGNSAGRMRTYVFADVPGSAGCAGGTVQDPVGRYYLSLATGNRFGPSGFTERALADFTTVRLWSEPAYIVNDLKSGGPPSRVVVWDYVPIGGEPALPVGALGEGWRVGHDERIAVRCHWAWSTLYHYRRTEYVRRPSQERR